MKNITRLIKDLENVTNWTEKCRDQWEQDGAAYDAYHNLLVAVEVLNLSILKYIRAEIKYPKRRDVS